MYFEPLLTELNVLMRMSLDPKISRQLGKGRPIVLLTYLQKRKTIKNLMYVVIYKQFSYFQ